MAEISGAKVRPAALQMSTMFSFIYCIVLIEEKDKGKPRKDHFLVPVNSDFNLYSMGADGQTQTPFTAARARDDIVRANDGGYVGLASDY